MVLRLPIDRRAILARTARVQGEVMNVMEALYPLPCACGVE